MHESGQSHFLTFSCYRRRQKFVPAAACDLFLACLEEMRGKFAMCIYGYVVMPEHVHLLLSEPKVKKLGDAMHWLKLAFAKRWKSRTPYKGNGPFWQARGFDRNVRDAVEFSNELDYIHRNPVERGLVKEPEEWKWSSYRHYARREAGPVEIESEWTARDREAKTTGKKRKFLPPPPSGPG
jgi:putative transposase